MRNHITSAAEMREWGIAIQPFGEHRIRVLGALKECPLPGPTPAKEDLESRGADASIEEGYADGALQDSQQDPHAEIYHPRIPALFITRTGEPVFLKRDWT